MLRDLPCSDTSFMVLARAGELVRPWISHFGRPFPLLRSKKDLSILSQKSLLRNRKNAGILLVSCEKQVDFQSNGDPNGNPTRFRGATF